VRAGRRRRGRLIPVLAACFYAGVAAGWWLHATFSPQPAAGVVTPVPHPSAQPRAGAPAGTSGSGGRGGATSASDRTDAAATVPTVGADPVGELRRKGLRLPLDNANIAAMKGGFAESRSGGRRHEAVDILAPRHTPIRAVDDGTIARLFFSRAGGTTLYQFDPTGRFCYYYAHLQRYAPGIREGLRVSAGDVIGYVGTSGNAPPATPHLHFAIFQLTGERRWWEGRPVDPYLVFHERSAE
jgi:murein DD-endopeptidase MepM/ murein hydrolase activator NlpD